MSEKVITYEVTFWIAGGINTNIRFTVLEVLV